MNLIGTTVFIVTSTLMEWNARKISLLLLPNTTAVTTTDRQRVRRHRHRREERRMYRRWFWEILCDGRMVVYAHKYLPSSVLDISLIYASGGVQVVPSQLPSFPQNYR